MAEKKFLICFHDFSVWNYRTVMPILDELKELAGAPFSILLIPDTEGARKEDVEGFRTAISQLLSQGFEFALHGFKHRAEFSQGRSYVGLVAMNLTHGEAEFAGLSKFESERLLQAGISAWTDLVGDKPVAFVPPTWWSNDYLPKRVNELGMLYEYRYLLRNEAGRRYVSGVASFAGIPDFTIKPMFYIGKLLMKIPFGVPRIALHPEDFPKLMPRARDLIRSALGNQRKIVQYRDL